MDVTRFNLANPWRINKKWNVPDIPRSATEKIAKWINEPEILILLGARQVGKTSILYQLIDKLLKTESADNIYYFNLDVAGFKEFVSDTGKLLRFINVDEQCQKYVFIDEIQRLPDPGKFIKGIYDLRLGIKFILTGSSSLELKSKTAESLTGRKQIFKIFPLSFSEYFSAFSNIHLKDINKNNYELYLDVLNEFLYEYMLFGGYPAVVLSKNLDKKLLRLEEIFNSYIEKDIAGFLRIENIDAFKKLIVFLSAQQGNLVNISELTNSLNIHRETVVKYIRYLKETFVINEISPFFTNPRTELTKMKKIFFVDSGIRNFAINGFGQLDFRADKGQILEGIVANFLLNQFSNTNEKLNFWRTKSGAEVDFILSNLSPNFCVEVKSKTFKKMVFSRSLRSFIEKHKPETAILLNNNLWAEQIINKTRIQAIPSSVFILNQNN